MSARNLLVAKFSLGQIVATPNALSALSQDEILLGIARHQTGDWGELDEHDRQQNEEFLQQGLRLLSVYHAANGTRFWIITEANRSVTTVLLPEDY